LDKLLAHTSKLRKSAAKEPTTYEPAPYPVAHEPAPYGLAFYAPAPYAPAAYGLAPYGPTVNTLAAEEPAMFVDLEDQYFLGPDNGKEPYTSFCILDSIITVERHGKEIHIAARFNIETTILRYSSQKRSTLSRTVIYG